MSIFDRFLNKEKLITCEIQGDNIVFRFSRDETRISIDNTRTIEYEWDFAVGFSSSVVFYPMSGEEIIIDGHVLDGDSVVAALKKAFPGFMRDIDLKSFLDEAKMYGSDVFWSRTWLGNTN